MDRRILLILGLCVNRNSRFVEKAIVSKLDQTEVTTISAFYSL